MELKVKTPSFNEVVEFNFEELKKQIQDKAAEYKDLVYTDNDIKSAKADVATFRKLQKAINDEKIRVKKECLKPYEDFETKVKELMSIIDEPIVSISSQIAYYEEQRKHEKREDILTYWRDLQEEGKVPTGIDIFKIFDEKWLNASVKMSAITKEIDERLEKIINDLVTIENLPEFAYEAKEEYIRTLDISKAILEGKRQAEIQKKKLEELAEKQIEEINTAVAEEVEKIIEAEAPKTELRFWVKVTEKQAQDLRMFLDLNNIEFGAC